jgi:hypothetical protein
MTETEHSCDRSVTKYFGRKGMREEWLGAETVAFPGHALEVFPRTTGTKICSS